MSGDVNGALQRVVQALGDQLDAGAVLDVLGQHHELVTADTTERVGVAHDAVETRRDRPQQLVAGGVAERVVNAP